MLKAKSLHAVLKSSLAGGVETALLLADRGNSVLASASINAAFTRSPEHALVVAVVGNLWRAYATNDLAAPAAGAAAAGPAGGDLSREPAAPGGGGGSGGAGRRELEFLLVNAGDRRLCILPLQTGGPHAPGELLLCVTGVAGLELGMLKLRAVSLKAHLEGQLKTVGAPAAASETMIV